MQKSKVPSTLLDRRHLVVTQVANGIPPVADHKAGESDDSGEASRLSPCKRRGVVFVDGAPPSAFLRS